jgi:hypothetical protein
MLAHDVCDSGEAEMKAFWRTREDGQVLIYVAVSFVVLFGIIAFAFDVSHFLKERRRMQNAADAAALAGARALCTNGDASGAATSAAVLNGANVPDAPVVTGDSSGGSVKITASETAGSLYAQLVNLGNPTIGATALATCGSPCRACNMWAVGFSDTGIDLPPGADFAILQINPPNPPAGTWQVCYDWGVIGSDRVIPYDNGLWLSYPPNAPMPPGPNPCQPDSGWYEIKGQNSDKQQCNACVTGRDSITNNGQLPGDGWSALYGRSLGVVHLAGINNGVLQRVICAELVRQQHDFLPYDDHASIDKAWASLIGNETCNPPDPDGNPVPLPDPNYAFYGVHLKVLEQTDPRCFDPLGSASNCTSPQRLPGGVKTVSLMPPSP